MATECNERNHLGANLDSYSMRKEVINMPWTWNTLIKWRVYWASMLTGLCIVLLIKNWYMYTNKNWRFKIGKSIIEGVLLVAFAVWIPAFLVVYSSMWLTQRIDRPAIRTAASILAGIGLTVLGGRFLEALVIMGCFGIELLSRDFLSYYREHREQRLAQAA